MFTIKSKLIASLLAPLTVFGVAAVEAPTAQAYRQDCSNQNGHCGND